MQFYMLQTLKKLHKSDILSHYLNGIKVFVDELQEQNFFLLYIREEIILLAAGKEHTLDERRHYRKRITYN